MTHAEHTHALETSGPFGAEIPGLDQLPDPAPELARLLSEIWLPRSPMAPSAWATAHHELSDRISATPGRFDLGMAPHLREILDVFADPDVSEITLCMASQTQKTTALEVMIFWSIDQDPSPILLIWPTKDLVTRNVKGRLRPSIQASQRIRRLRVDTVAGAGRRGRGKPESGDAVSMIRFRDCDLFIAWSNSESQRRSTAARAVIIDEFDSCDASTLADARDRVSTFARRKIVKAGVPGIAGAGLDEQLELSDHREFYRPCPAPFGGCGHYQVFTIEQVGWDGDFSSSPDQAERTAFVRCRACDFKVRDHHKRWINQRGVWATKHQRVEQGQVTEQDPDPAPRVVWKAGPVPKSSHAGFHFPAILAPTFTLGQLAREWHECKGLPSVDFTTRRLARGWRASVSQAEMAKLRARRRKVDAGGHRLRTVPPWCMRILMAVDVQHDLVWFAAWGINQGGTRQCLIDYGSEPAPQGDQLLSVDPIIRRRYPLTAGHPGLAMGGAAMMPLATIMDQQHRWDEVHAFRRRNLEAGRQVWVARGWVPQKHLLGEKWRLMYAATPQGKTQIGPPVGINIHVDFWKGYVLNRLSPPAEPMPDSPAPWDLPEDVGDDFLMQLTAEHLVVEKVRGVSRLVWRLRPGRRDNHMLDLAVYASACHDAMTTANLKTPRGLVTAAGEPIILRTTPQTPAASGPGPGPDARDAGPRDRTPGPMDFYRDR